MKNLLALLILTLLLSGCGERVTPVEAANRAGILIKANGTDPATLDPHLATGITEMNILDALIEGLMRPNPKTLDPEPAVAESYTLSEDGLRYTFHLRPTARWSNGDPVTADDFLFSFRRILTPEFGAEYAYMLYPMQNAAAYHRGEISDFSLVGARAPDPHTLEITLENPVPHFLSLLLHFTWWPVHPPTILAHGGMSARDSPWTRPDHFVGNGPFNLHTWSISEELKVRKSPTYWDADNVALNAIRFLPIDNLNTEERAFRAGQVHITESIPLSKIESYRQRQDPTLHINPYLGVYYYLLNTQRPPLDDPRVRQALSLAIDRHAITENILKGGQQPAYHFTPPDTGGYTTDYRLHEDIAKARQLLAQAGYPEGQGFPRLEILYNTSESHKLIAEAIQQMWQQNLGIHIGLINQDWKVYLQSRRDGNYDIARAAWIGDYPDPINFLELMASWSGNNHSRWGDPAYDQLIEQASREPHPATRFALLQQAEALGLQATPVIPIYFYVSAYLISPSVQGWYPNILNRHPYHAVSLKP